MSKDHNLEISHDLRSPLSVLLGYLDFKAAGDGTPEEEKQYLEALRKSADKLFAIAEKLAGRGGTVKSGADAPMAPPAPARAKLTGKSALVVDDDDGLRLQWKAILNRRGFDAVEARSGEDLLVMNLDLSAVAFAVVDYHYEGSDLNGLDVIEYLKRKTQAPVYLCTANYEDASLCRKALALGVKSVLPKPIRAESCRAIFGE